MPRQEPKKRRGPYSRYLPPEIAANGYVADLNFAIRQAAESHGASVSVIRKNRDLYLAVLVPTPAEMAQIDAATDADIPAGE